MPPRLKAFFLLALAVIRTVFRRLVGGGRNGLAEFRANYAADGLAPVLPGERIAMAEFGRCIACGLCDRGESRRMAASNGAYRGIMEAVLSGSRSMPDYAAAAASFAHVPDSGLAEKEGICPTGVPMRKMAAFVREKAGEARVSIPAGAPPRALPVAH